MDAAETRPQVRSMRGEDRITGDAARATVVLAMVILALVAVAGWIGRRLWFFSDDWNIYADYYSGNLLEPFNGHLSLVPAGAYQTLFHTLGVGSYLPYRVCGLAALCVLGFQVARWAADRVGWWTAVTAVTAILWNSFGTTNVMFPFLMNFSLPIAALLAIWWHLDRLEEGASGQGSVDPADQEANTGRSHLVAISLWLAVALATSGLGVVAAVAVVVELAVRRPPWRMWTAVLGPVALWSVWWLGHREANELSTDVGEVAAYAMRMLWAGTTSVAAGSRPGGLLVAAVLASTVLAASVLRRRLDPRVIGALAAAFSFAGLTALTRQDTTPPIPPDELRYGWTIGAYLVLAAVAAVSCLGGEAAEGSPSPGNPTIELPRAALVAAAVIAVGVLGLGAVRLLDGMIQWSDTVADAAPGLRSNIYATEAVGSERMAPGTVIRPLSFVPVSAESYLGAVAEVGSPLEGAVESDIGGREDQRRAADEILFDSLAFSLTSPPVLAAERSCGAGVGALPGQQVLVRTGTVTGADALREPTLHLSRFGTEPALSLAVEAGGVHTLVIPEDAPVGTTAVVPYNLVGVGGVTVCVPT